MQTGRSGRLFSAGTMVLTLASIASATTACRAVPKLPSALALASSTCPYTPFVRDWTKNPPLAVIDDPNRRLYVMGDIHGDYKDLVASLLQLQVMVKGGSDYVWNAGSDIFVFLGDLMDKGDDSYDTVKLVMELDTQAKAAGGQVIALAGNHEMAFMADPANSKADTFLKELKKLSLDVCNDVYAPSSEIGSWLRQRPAAAIVNGMYMSHSGWAGGVGREGIATAFRAAMDSGSYDSDFTCGNHTKHATAGFFNNNVWWGKKGDDLDAQTKELGVTQVLFGHDPGAFDDKGKPKAYFVDDKDPGSRGLFKLDVGMWEGDGDPSIFICKKWRPGGGCAKPKVFKRANHHSGPDEVDDFPTKDDDPPKEDVPDPRSGC